MYGVYAVFTRTTAQNGEKPAIRRDENLDTTRARRTLRKERLGVIGIRPMAPMEKDR
jgi:hypothetical protein